MKVKVILKSLLFSYAVTGAFLLLLAFLLFQFDLGEKPVTSGRGFLLFAFDYGIFCSAGKMGYESGTCSYYFFYVSGWWCSWWDVVLEHV